ncbi:unnamed protein product [Caenorhabditis nigoni]
MKLDVQQRIIEDNVEVVATKTMTTRSVTRAAQRLFHKWCHVQGTHSRVGESSCAMQGVHLDGVTEEVLVLKESSGHKANEHEVNEEGHPLKFANTEVIKEMLALKTAQQRRILEDHVQSMSPLTRIEFL